MATVQINAQDYAAFIDVADADKYLAADVSRAPVWEALAADDKARALVTATRLLQRLQWRGDVVPTTDDPVAEPVADATALLAVDIINKPTLGDSASTGSNVKAVGAGPARVEFFRPSEGQSLPPAAFELLRGLLGPGAELDDPALDNTAFGSSFCWPCGYGPRDFDPLGARFNPNSPIEWW